MGSERDPRHEPRRFVVPGMRQQSPLSAGTSGELRRLVREGGILLGVEQTSLFVFGEKEGEPVRRVVRFHLADRRFEDAELHPPELAREVRAFLSKVSRAEVGDLREHAPPPGAMRDYLSDAGVRGLLSLPLKKGDRTIGFVSFETISGPRRWTEHDRVRAQEIAGRLEALLPSARLEDAAKTRRDAEGATARGNASAQPGVGEREIRSRLRRLRPLEGAALIGADLGAELLHLIEVQEGSLHLLHEMLDGAEESAVVDDLREISDRLRKDLGSIVRSGRDGMAGSDVMDLASVVASGVPRLAAIAGERVRFFVSPCADPLPVRGNPELIERAVRHLIENARRAVHSSGTIRVSWARTQSGSELEGEFARIEVEDDGEGIRPEHLPWIFEPYFSAAGETPGLGLSSVQAVVEGHGGWVDVDSRVGEGTVMAIYLPLADPASPVETDGAPRVLVLEDEPALARLLERTLLREGLQVEVAPSVSAARRAWEARGGAFELLLVERRLTDALPLARSWKEARDALEIVVVDRKADSTRPPAGDPIADDTLLPPFEPAKLSRIVRDRLEAAAVQIDRVETDLPPPGGLAH